MMLLYAALSSFFSHCGLRLESIIITDVEFLSEIYLSFCSFNWVYRKVSFSCALQMDFKVV